MQKRQDLIRHIFKSIATSQTSTREKRYSNVLQQVEVGTYKVELPGLKIVPTQRETERECHANKKPCTHTTCPHRLDSLHTSCC